MKLSKVLPSILSCFITEIVPVWEYKGEGVEKNVFSFQDQRRTTQATNLQLPKSYLYLQKVKVGPITSFRPSQVTGYQGIMVAGVRGGGD